MTWEAVGVIVGTLAAFAAIVSGLAWVFWRRLAHWDREMRGDIRLSARDKQAVAGNDVAHPWWVS